MPCHTARNAATLSLLSFGLIACQDDSTSPNTNSEFLSGTYELNDWSYVLRGDTLPMTDDSFLRVDFREEGDVEGEGLVQLVQPLSGGGADTVTVLGAPVDQTDWSPLELRGSHVLAENGGSEVLRFSFQTNQGAGTWVESFDWVVAEDRSSYRFDLTSDVEIIEIEHRRR